MKTILQPDGISFKTYHSYHGDLVALIEYVVIHIQSSEVKKPRNTPARVKVVSSLNPFSLGR